MITEILTLEPRRAFPSKAAARHTIRHVTVLAGRDRPVQIARKAVVWHHIGTVGEGRVKPLAPRGLLGVHVVGFLGGVWFTVGHWGVGAIGLLHRDGVAHLVAGRTCSRSLVEGRMNRRGGRVQVHPWSVGNIRIRPPPRINRVQNQPTIAVAITGREFQRGPDSVVFHWVTRHGHGRNGAVANLTVDAVEVILEKAVLKGRTIRRKRMTAVPTHRSMAADAVFARVGGILVRNGQGGMPNRISR